MENKHCKQCDEKMSDVFNAGEGFKFKGWYCIRCNIYDTDIPPEVQKTMDARYGDQARIVR